MLNPRQRYDVKYYTSVGHNGIRQVQQHLLIFVFRQQTELLVNLRPLPLLCTRKELALTIE